MVRLAYAVYAVKIGTANVERLLKRLPLERLMDLKVDFAFKQLFGHDKNKHITIIFLNAILKREGDDRIQDITFVNTEFSGEHESDKESRLDILATTNNRIAFA